MGSGVETLVQDRRGGDWTQAGSADSTEWLWGANTSNLVFPHILIWKREGSNHGL